MEGSGEGDRVRAFVTPTGKTWRGPTRVTPGREGSALICCLRQGSDMILLYCQILTEIASCAMDQHDSAAVQIESDYLVEVKYLAWK